MPSFVRFAVPLAAIVFAAIPAAAQERSVPLARVAAETGYTYAWLSGEAAVSLSRPGVVVVFRAGEQLYRVGDRMISADRAPEFDGTDLVVSPATVAALRSIALAFPVPPPPRVTPAPATSASGALTVDVAQIPGHEQVAVRGRGPANLPITITLTGEISEDVPVVVLSRTVAHTGPDGTFEAVIGISVSPSPGNTIIATATSLPGVTPASKRITVVPTSLGVDSPMDKMPQ
jgi:hypothetical protein